ncbi:MAG: hypothetical protein R2838_17015 [Caldilineaceae bacterium]
MLKIDMPAGRQLPTTDGDGIHADHGLHQRPGSNAGPALQRPHGDAEQRTPKSAALRTPTATPPTWPGQAVRAW